MSLSAEAFEPWQCMRRWCLEPWPSFDGVPRWALVSNEGYSWRLRGHRDWTLQKAIAEKMIALAQCRVMYAWQVDRGVITRHAGRVMRDAQVMS